MYFFTNSLKFMLQDYDFTFCRSSLNAYYSFLIGHLSLIQQCISFHISTLSSKIDTFFLISWGWIFHLTLEIQRHDKTFSISTSPTYFKPGLSLNQKFRKMSTWAWESSFVANNTCNNYWLQSNYSEKISLGMYLLQTAIPLISLLAATGNTTFELLYLNFAFRKYPIRDSNLFRS